jgi:two-component system chemotaxis response regulator CheB
MGVMMIKVLIVDDSATERFILKEMFESEADFQVIATARNGKEAVLLTKKLKPDVITMDIIMPMMDGIEAIKDIMQSFPTPIVVISSKLNDEVLNASYRALESGALSVLEKPTNIYSREFEFQRLQIVDTVRAMAGIKVIRRKLRLKHKATPTSFPKIAAPIEVIAMGASIGGPAALKVILSGLPKHFPLPILIVQHMSLGFMEGFVKWLGQSVDIPLKSAVDLEKITPGVVYFAPDNKHLELKRLNGELTIKLTNEPLVGGFRPSVTKMFESVSEVCGNRSLGVLLTGMGRDGADGLLKIKKSQGYTIVQDEKSSIVFGMPGVAKSIGAADNELPLESIADYLIQLTKR